MAEAIVSLAIERISDLLIHEAVFLHGVREEVEGLKAELQRMKSSLIDADRKQDQDELTCTLSAWGASVRPLLQEKPTEVLQDLLIKLLPREQDDDKLVETQLVKKLYDGLKEKRYLIVLDDIWKSDDWDKFKPAFPKGKKGSKILFTTRHKNVAVHADPCSSPVELSFLTDDESWKLFRMKAFPENKTESHVCPEALEMPGREMVKRCGGLPLAIAVLGGLLATKKTRAEWEMVQRNINARLNNFPLQDDYGKVNGILSLSYTELPFHLKPCFLYLGHYPEDWEISKRELIRLWIAEGFISPSWESGEMLMEDVAEQFLEQLINRCLVQVGKRDHTGVGVKTCHVHDLLRDLCVKKAQEENFLKIIQPPLNESDGSNGCIGKAASFEDSFL
ncbi:NB-ARC - like 10 [Theobroma cacao]|nr:NB-ARC - like 10 [Theobroma cacao]